MAFDKALSQNLFQLDAAKEVDALCARMKSLLVHPLKRRGLVVGISGGIDSSVCLALAVRALGPEKSGCPANARNAFFRRNAWDKRSACRPFWRQGPA